MLAPSCEWTGLWAVADLIFCHVNFNLIRQFITKGFSREHSIKPTVGSGKHAALRVKAHSRRGGNLFARNSPRSSDSFPESPPGRGLSAPGSSWSPGRAGASHSRNGATSTATFSIFSQPPGGEW